MYWNSCYFLPSTSNSDYFNSTDLHIGVTTSTGVIVEFDRCGLRKNLDKGCKTLWAQSMLVETVPEAWMDHWDDVLEEVGVFSPFEQVFE